MAEKILFKRYSNRRLYDTDSSIYVTLDEVASRIKQGCRIEVVDADTQEDITAYVLTQILLEEARKKNFLLPAPLLHLAIRFGNDVLAEFFEKYLQEIIRNYVSYQTLASEQFRQWMNVGFGFSETARKKALEMNPLLAYLDTFFRPEGKAGREK